MRITLTMLSLMIVTGLAGCAGHAHRSPSLRVGNTVLYCEHRTGARFTKPSDCERMDARQVQSMLASPRR
jgi:hypothetical protein